MYCQLISLLIAANIRTYILARAEAELVSLKKPKYTSAVIYMEVLPVKVLRFGSVYE